MLLLGIAAIGYVGGSSHLGTVDTVTSSFSTELPPEALAVEAVEIAPEVTGSTLLADSTQTAQDLIADSQWMAAVEGPQIAAAKKPTGTFGGAFFGVGGDKGGSAGQRIVYIVDQSGSMSRPLVRQTRFQRVQRELENAILSLNVEQKFLVLLFNQNSHEVGFNSTVLATERNKNRVLTKIWKAKPDGFTNPSGAIKRALRMKPDTIFFLTDGEFKRELADKLMQRRYGMTVHTFTLGDNSGEAVMKLIAQINGGTYTFVSGDPNDKNSGKAQTVDVPSLSGSGS